VTVATQSPALARVTIEGAEVLPVIDTDVHPRIAPTDPRFLNRLPERWRRHMDLIGLRTNELEAQVPRQRPFASRTDAVPPGGGIPGGDPEHAQHQLLDAYQMTAAVLNNITAMSWSRGTGNHPVPFQLAIARAINDWHHEEWFSSDPRWRASINVPWELPHEAVKEIERCRALSDRFIQVVLEARADEPIGNPRYWPLFEAAESTGIPVAFHVGGNRRMTGSGTPSFYFEDHVDFALRNFNVVASLIFEGVFDRFPALKVVFLEQGWSWVVPYAWRLDAAWSVLRAEVSHLERRPSDYIKDHFWFSSQPMEEPERLEWIPEVLGLFEDFGMTRRLMFSSDYPHWDFDAPDESIPLTLPVPTRKRLLAANASDLYGIPV
jgi:predicted TIM-barrel fold metal-dependent hydrolase